MYCLPGLPGLPKQIMRLCHIGASVGVSLAAVTVFAALNSCEVLTFSILRRLVLHFFRRERRAPETFRGGVKEQPANPLLPPQQDHSRVSY